VPTAEGFLELNVIALLGHLSNFFGSVGGHLPLRFVKAHVHNLEISNGHGHNHTIIICLLNILCQVFSGRCVSSIVGSSSSIANGCKFVDLGILIGASRLGVVVVFE